MPEPWAGGRIVPARGVDVDMISEDLRATIQPEEASKGQPVGESGGARILLSSSGKSGTCVASVAVRYVLRAEKRGKVAIIFPIVYGPAEVTMSLGGRRLRVAMASDVDVFSAYEAKWRSAIDAYIAGDPFLSRLAAEARQERSAGVAAERAARRTAAEHAAAHTRTGGSLPPGAASPPRASSPAPEPVPGLLPDASRFLAQFAQPLARHLALKGFGDRSQVLGWELMHYMTEDWQALAWARRLRGQPDPDTARRVRLWAVRDLAVTFVPQSPDPVGLWQGAGELWHLDRRILPDGFVPPLAHMSFAACQLPLRAGDNAFEVDYTQQVGDVPEYFARQARPGLPPPAMVIDGAAGEFSFILRTARFWRSFGKLAARVVLPAGTKFAECSLPGATVSDVGGAKVVTYVGEGLPKENLHIVFAPAEPTQDPFASRRAAAVAVGGSGASASPSASVDDAPAVTLKPEWSTTLTSESEAFAKAPIVVQGGVIAAAAGDVVALCDPATGRVIRQMSVAQGGGKASRPRTPPRVQASGLALTARDVVVGTSVGAVCFDRATGARRWEARPESHDYNGHPTRVRVVGGVVLAVSHRGPAFAVDLKTGRLLWQQRFEAWGAAVDEKASGGARVYVAGQTADSSEGTGRLIALDLGTGRELWRVESGNLFGPPVFAKGRLYMAGNGERYRKPFLSCLSASSGKMVWQVDWPGSHVSGFNQLWPPILRGSTLYVPDDRALHAFRLGAKPKLLWTIKYSLQPSLGPTWAGDYAYLPLRMSVAEADLRTGRVLWRDSVRQMWGPVAVADGRIYGLSLLGGVLTAYREPSEPAAPVAVAGAGQGGGSQGGAQAAPALVVGPPPLDLAEVVLRGGGRGGGLVGRGEAAATNSPGGSVYPPPSDYSAGLVTRDGSHHGGLPGESRAAAASGPGGHVHAVPWDHSAALVLLLLVLVAATVWLRLRLRPRRHV